MSISVIVPTHNTCELTLRCLESVARASAEAVEIVVVDDGSVDDTVELVRARFPTARIVCRATAGGFTAAANAGLRESSGDLMFLLNSDTEIAPDVILRMKEAFVANPRLGAGGAVLHFPDGGPQWSGGQEPGGLWIFVLATGVTGLLARLPGYRVVRSLEAAKRGPVKWVNGAAMVIRREAWLQAGALDESFRFYCQDLDYCLRLGDLGWDIATIPEARVLHHGGASIGKRAGSVEGNYNPELLWTDLVRVADKRHGRLRAQSIARLLRYGGRMRLLARRLVAPVLLGEKRQRWKRDTEAFARAIKGLSAW
jgi:N-acetylglucosaminyl-diphospho-decaprenol L-rhamnosyltransferase